MLGVVGVVMMSCTSQQWLLPALPFPQETGAEAGNVLLPRGGALLRAANARASKTQCLNPTSTLHYSLPFLGPWRSLNNRLAGGGGEPHSPRQDSSFKLPTSPTGLS